jgi:hypothetical protein
MCFRFVRNKIQSIKLYATIPGYAETDRYLELYDF